MLRYVMSILFYSLSLLARFDELATKTFNPLSKYVRDITYVHFVLTFYQLSGIQPDGELLLLQLKPG